MRVTTSQYETSGKKNAHLLSHHLPVCPLEKKFIGTSSILARSKCRVLPTDSTCQIVTGTAVIFHLAGRQERQYVSPLNIITILSLSSALISSTPSNVSVTSAICLI